MTHISHFDPVGKPENMVFVIGENIYFDGGEYEIQHKEHQYLELPVYQPPYQGYISLEFTDSKLEVYYDCENWFNQDDIRIVFYRKDGKTVPIKPDNITFGRDKLRQQFESLEVGDKLRWDGRREWTTVTTKRFMRKNRGEVKLEGQRGGWYRMKYKYPAKKYVVIRVRDHETVGSGHNYEVQ